jgi:hypothetical protein
MARRAKKKQEVSLFPFLDILACVIGNLILIITAVVLEQVDTKPIAQAAEREQVKEETRQNLIKLEQLQAELQRLKDESRSSDKRIEEAEQKLKDAEKARLAAKERLADVPPPPPPPDEKDIANQKKKQLEIEELLEEIKKIEAEIAQRKKQPEQTITILPANRGGGKPREPVYVEINAQGIVIVGDDKQFKKVFGDEKSRSITPDKIKGSAEMKKLLEFTLSNKNSIVTFLLRPDALGVYSTVEGVVREFERANQKKLVIGILPNGAEVLRSLTGKVPLPGEGVLDFSKAD